MGTAKYAKDYFREIANSSDAETQMYYVWRTIKAIENSGQRAIDFETQDLVLLAAEDRFSDVCVVLLELVMRGQIKLSHNKDGILCVEITESGQQASDLIEPVLVNSIEIKAPTYDGFVDSYKNICGVEND